MKYKNTLLFFSIALILSSCQSPKKTDIPTIGFVDAFEDATIAKARTGFVDANS